MVSWIISAHLQTPPPPPPFLFLFLAPLLPRFFDKNLFLPHMNKTNVLVTWRTIVLCPVYIFALCQSSPEIFVVTVSRFVLEKQLPSLFLKIGLLFWICHHNIVIFKVIAIKLCMIQTCTISLVLFYGYVYAFSSVCAINCYVEQNCRQNTWMCMKLP